MKELFNAGRFLAADFLSTILFVAVFALSKNIAVATGVAIATGIGQIGWERLRGKPIDAMQWMSLALVVVFGSATLFTRDPRFILVKPSVIYVVVGAFMLRRGWMVLYMPPIVLENAADVVVGFGYAWSGLMFATAAANLWVALSFDAKTWAWFIGVFPMASKLILFGVQFMVTRMITRRRVRALAAPQAEPA